VRPGGAHLAPLRVSAMTLRPEYSLGHSAYNDFLFGTVGQDAAGTEITVLSALSRLGVDPWQEAARLAALPRDAAASALAATLARLPDGTWPEAEAEKIAARLVALLPEGAVADIPQTSEARVASLAAAVQSGRAGNKAKSAAKGTGNGAPVSASPAAPAAARGPKPSLTTWLVWGALALALYFLIVQMTSDSNLETSGQETTQQ